MIEINKIISMDIGVDYLILFFSIFYFFYISFILFYMSLYIYYILYTIYINIYIYICMYTLHNGSTQVKPEHSISRAIYAMVWVR